MSDARQPAAIDKQGAATAARIAAAERAAYEVSGHRAGEKWTKAFAEALLANHAADLNSEVPPEILTDDEARLIDAWHNGQFDSDYDRPQAQTVRDVLYRMCAKWFEDKVPF